MGLRESKKYINDLHRRQSDPYQWPDFMTGLPDRTAVNAKLAEVHGKLDRYEVAYIKIGNIHPYLVKYGTSKHVELIQWAAAILATTIREYGGFVGALSSHDFLAICRKGRFDEFMAEAESLFQKKTRPYYTEDDLRQGAVLSFVKDGEDVTLGLMRLVHCSTNGSGNIPLDQIISTLERDCQD